MSGAQQLFDELNRQYFGGRLLRYRVRFRSSAAPGGAHGKCDDESHTIVLLRGLSETTTPTVRQILLHEMCHIRSPGHGRRWQAKMEGLARLGETWARDEIRQYREEIARRRPATALIKDHLEELSWDMRKIPRWPAALRSVAYERGLEPRDVLRIAPWAPRVWKCLIDARRARDRAREELRRKFKGHSSGPPR